MQACDSPDSKRRILKDVFGFEQFRPGQEEAMAHLLAGRPVLTVMPTGAGKSLCYQVPALVLGGLTVVVSPLVALMRDQVAALRLAGVAAESINSSQGREDNIAAWRRVAAGEARLLYLAPERLMTARMLDALAKLDVRLIAIDEAHCISQWGPAFRPEYEELGRLRTMFPGTPIIALTATADESTRADIAAKLFAGKVESLVLGFDRPNIKLHVSARRDGKRQLLDFVQRHAGRPGIVYCLSRKKTEETAAFLVRHGVKALAYHAGMSKEAREANQNAFMTEPALAMVATIAFGMGIDKPDVAYVFHTDLPGSLEAYYQEIGRAGRDGGPAEAHMLFGLGDIRMRRMFIDDEETSADHKRRAHARLGTLIGYCETASCRRQVLLNYFGERAEACGNCDNCLDRSPRLDGTAEARLILAAMAETGGRFGPAHIVDVLRGGETQKVVERGHHRLPSFASGAGRRKEEWHSLIRQMVAAELLCLDVDGHGGLSAGPQSARLLRDEIPFHFRPEAPAVKSRRAERQGQGQDAPPADDVLLAGLKALRLSLAKQRRVPAFVIFSDRTLLELAARRPADAEAFAQIHGVGAAKLKDFAQVFLRAIAEHG